MSATEQLDDRIRELVLRGDMEAIVRLVASSRAIATALEAENAALREFVRLVDDVVFLMAHREDGDRFHDARQRLATDHGLPLPGAGEDGR